MRTRGALDLLGETVVDRVTKLQGVVTSVSYDVSGCIQALVSPAAVDGKVLDMHWYDLNRIEVIPDHRAMKVPDFTNTFDTGPETKPIPPNKP